MAISFYSVSMSKGESNLLFKVIEEKEFQKIVKEFNYNFYQNAAWAQVKKANGWIHLYTAVYQDNKPILASLILGKKIFNKYLYYAPRGPLVKEEVDIKEVYAFYLQEVKKYLKTQKGFTFKFDPMITYQDHDKDGNVVSENNNQEFVDFLKKQGTKHRGFTIGYTNEAQFRWSYALDIKDKKFNDLMTDMNSRCKRSLKKADKYPLILKDVDDISIKDFKDIMESTAERQHHGDRTLKYYETLKTELKSIIRMCLIYLDKEKLLEGLATGTYKLDEDMVDDIKNDKKALIPLSAGVFIEDKDRLNYVYGGTYSKYFPFMAPYKMQEEMIKYAIEKKKDFYDFGGISGDFKPGSKEYGVYEYKRGYGGFVIEYIGEFDLIIDYPFFLFYKYGFAIYRNFKKIIYGLRK